MGRIIASFFLALSFMTYGQENLNDYKYIIVPKKFEGFKEQNAHQTSTLVKHFLTKNGFLVIYDDAFLDELNTNRCLALVTSLLDESSSFSTKTTVVLKNCKGEIVFKTKQGTSREKDYKTGYSEAIKQAMVSFESVNYVYSGTIENTEPITLNFKNDIKKLKEDKKELIGKTTKIASAASELVVEELEANIENAIVVQEATTENQLFESMEPEASNIKETKTVEIKKLKILKPRNDEVWYAQTLPIGYQLVGSSPKIRMKLLKSSTENVYMAQGNDKNGIVYQKEGKWIFEYYEGDTLMQKEMSIKF